jgi:hypothetical protein
MHVSIFVSILEARETQKGVRMAIDRLDNVVDEGYACQLSSKPWTNIPTVS